MHVDNVRGNVVVKLIILLIKDQEEDVKSGHDRSTDVKVIPQRSGSIVSAVYWVSGSKD